MKLFVKYNRITLLSTIVIFLLSGIAFFFLLRYVLISQVDEDLKIEENEINQYIKNNNRLPEIIEVHDQQTQYKLLDAGTVYKKRKFNTVKEYDKHEQEKALFREINFTVTANNQSYGVTVRKSLEGTEDMIRAVILITLATILLILAASFFINRIVLKNLWKPFYKTVDAIKSFRLHSNAGLQLEKTNIDEFAQMNQALEQSINKAKHDYVLLKEFTENASHELQTPLAIIRSKLDLIIQEENLSEHQSKALQGAYNAISRITRINQSLLLLAKIENRQFEKTASLNWKDVVNNKIDEFKELWQNNHIEISAAAQDAYININPSLSEILLNNLFSNATRHNKNNGQISLLLKQNYFCISNTGIAKPLDQERLFSRFSRNNESPEHHGLGLSIVYQICEVTGCRIVYSFSAPGVHSFIIEW